jgi:hypothetical protein
MTPRPMAGVAVAADHVHDPAAAAGRRVERVAGLHALHGRAGLARHLPGPETAKKPCYNNLSSPITQLLFLFQLERFCFCFC